MYRVTAWITAAVCCALGCAPAAAQTARSGGSASAQLMQQMQQVATERTALQGENDKLKAQIASLTKERDGLKAGQQALDKRAKDATAALSRSGAANSATEQELTQTKAKMQELIGKFRETIQKLREVETQGTAAQQALVTRERELTTCIDRNVALYNLNDEVLKRLEHQGFWTRAAQAEPFTKVKRIELENDIDGYRARAQDQRMSPASRPAPSPASGPAGTTGSASPAASLPPVPPSSAASASPAPTAVASPSTAPAQ
jgi:hypothetical protein